MSSGRLRAVALQARDDVGPVRLEREELRRNAFLVEHLLQVLDGRPLVAGRVAGVDAQQRLEVAHRLFFDLRPVRLLRTRACASSVADPRHCEHDRDISREPRHLVLISSLDSVVRDNSCGRGRSCRRRR